jgi:hypothetical protein
MHVTFCDQDLESKKQQKLKSDPGNIFLKNFVDILLFTLEKQYQVMELCIK